MCQPSGHPRSPLSCAAAAVDGELRFFVTEWNAIAAGRTVSERRCTVANRRRRRRAFGEELGRGAEGADWSVAVGQERMFSSLEIAVGSALWCVLRAAGGRHREQGIGGTAGGGRPRMECCPAGRHRYKCVLRILASRPDPDRPDRYLK